MARRGRAAVCGTDRGSPCGQIKPELYAAAGVPDYWVVDGMAKRVRVFREPRGDGYASRTALGPGGFAEPVAVDVPPLDLAELFRGL